VSIHLVTVVSCMKIPPAAKLLLLGLAESAVDNDLRLAFPGHERLVEWTGLTDRQTRRVMNDLIDNGLVDRVQRGQKYRRAEYRVLPFGCCEKHQAWSSAGHNVVPLRDDPQPEHHVRLNGSQADIG
jgi:hypothetical protein